MACSYSRRVTWKSGSNFAWSFIFLPRKKRNAIYTIYAFSRLVDDAVDEAKSEEKARQELDLWRQRLDLCYAKKLTSTIDLQHPIIPELISTIQEFNIPELYFYDLLKGVEMDLTQKRYETFEELSR